MSYDFEREEWLAARDLDPFTDTPDWADVTDCGQTWPIPNEDQLEQSAYAPEQDNWEPLDGPVLTGRGDCYPDLALAGQEAVADSSQVGVDTTPEGW